MQFMKIQRIDAGIPAGGEFTRRQRPEGVVALHAQGQVTLVEQGYEDPKTHGNTGIAGGEGNYSPLVGEPYKGGGKRTAENGGGMSYVKTPLTGWLSELLEQKAPGRPGAFFVSTRSG
jgi:hypothetical protein